MNAPTLPLEAIAREAAAFRDAFRTLHLATTAADGTPSASYAPFALSDAGHPQIFVSELAAHTANLQRGTTISALLIEAEQDAAHLFARKRLTLTCTPRHCPRSCAMASGGPASSACTMRSGFSARIGSADNARR